MAVAEAKKCDTAALLFQTARDFAGRNGFRFGESASGVIERLAADAAQSIEERAKKESVAVEEFTAEGKRAFELLVYEMIKASEYIEAYAIQNPGRIGEPTLRAAMTKLCPLWPIC